MRSAVSLLAALALAGCADYAAVKPRGVVMPAPPGTGALVSAEKELGAALRNRHSKPLVALGDCVEALDTAWGELRRNPANSTARRDYNFALGRAFQIIKEGRIDAFSK